jgi:hypothetical protein
MGCAWGLARDPLNAPQNEKIGHEDTSIHYWTRVSWVFLLFEVNGLIIPWLSKWVRNFLSYDRNWCDRRHTFFPVSHSTPGFTDCDLETCNVKLTAFAARSRAHAASKDCHVGGWHARRLRQSICPEDVAWPVWETWSMDWREASWGVMGISTSNRG